MIEHDIVATDFSAFVSSFNVQADTTRYEQQARGFRSAVVELWSDGPDPDTQSQARGTFMEPMPVRTTTSMY